MEKIIDNTKRNNNSLKKSKEKYDKSVALFAYSVFFIPIVHFILFTVLVKGLSVVLAFQDNEGAFTFFNFKYILTQLVIGGSDTFLQLRNTCMFFAVSILLIPVNVFISVVIYKKIFMHKVFQFIFFLPSIIGAIIWMSAYKNFLGPNGPLTVMLKNMGVEPVPQFLADSQYAIWACIMANVWLEIPGNMLIYCGTLTRIPKEVLEAGRLDGVGLFREIFQVIIPLIWPSISTNFIFTVIGFLGANGPILLLTQGKYDTFTIAFWFESVVLKQDTMNFNSASAFGVLMTLFTIPLTVIGQKLANKVETVEY